MATIKNVQDLYRIDNKYWKTGDTDLLPARTMAARVINVRFYSEIANIARICTQKHYPVQTLVDVLTMLGFEIAEEEVDE